MTENESIKSLKEKYPLRLCDKDEYEMAQTAIQALEEVQQYRAIGTVEEIKQKLEELERWHTTEVNQKIKNVFANTSTQICHNCDHKDEYIMELEAEIEEYRKTMEKYKEIEHVVNMQLIAGKNNYKETHACFYEIAQIVQR